MVMEMSTKTSKEMTLSEFYDMTRCVRMIYGIEPATRFFETNIEEFTGFALSDLIKKVVKKNVPIEKNIQPDNIQSNT